MATLSSVPSTSATSAAQPVICAPDTPGPGPWINGSLEARIEELEEMLRRIVIVVHPDPRRPLSDTDGAVLAMACDALGLDTPVALAVVSRRRGTHLTAV